MDKLTQWQHQQAKLLALRSNEETPAQDVRNALQLLEVADLSFNPEYVTFSRSDFESVLSRLYTAVQKLEAK